MIKYISIIISLLIKITVSDKLIFVSTHFRHGARAPMKVDSNYKDHIKEVWTNPGELTGVGQRMLYLLGMRNRNRYIETYNFLSDKYDSHELLVYSTAFNRTILSAYAQLQGLYPESYGLGEKLNEEQEAKAFPAVKCDYPKIEEELKKIKGYAMPNLMTMIPVRMINNNEKKMTLYDIGECGTIRDSIKEKNRNNIPILVKMQKEFNEKYGKILNDFYEKEETYDYIFMNRFCDAIVSGVTNGKDLTEFKKTNIDIDKMENYCHEVQKMNYQEHILGDDKHILAPLEASKMMREIIHYMKQRIDADINQENIEEKYLDYSRPKMLMISGHDSTISCHEMFIISSLGFPVSYFRGAQYGSQLALEISRRDASVDEIKKMTYKDYNLSYYFDDELVFNITVDEYIKKIEPKLWTDEQIDEFCGFNTDKNSENTEKIEKNEKKNKSNIAYLIVCIFLIILILVFLIVILILYCKLKQLRIIRPLKDIKEIQIVKPYRK